MKNVGRGLPVLLRGGGDQFFLEIIFGYLCFSALIDIHMMLAVSVNFPNIIVNEVFQMIMSFLIV